MFGAQTDYYRAIFDVISDGVLICDRDGNIIDANSHMAQRFGKTRENMIGKTIKEILSYEKYNNLRTCRDQKVEEVFETKKMVVLEDSRDGKWYYNRYYPIIKAEVVVAVAIISTDITEVKDAEERKRQIELIEKEEAMQRQEDYNKSLLISTLTHELRTPLSTMTAWLSLIKLTSFNLEKIYFDIIEKEIKQIKHLSDNFINISQTETSVDYIRSFLPERKIH